ncbi:hypothetical protein NDU88_003705 [Pleurodeles waltl]|uniref:Secreted protein n=1 Tax=Pleurodeles waltl TaxID=8319 RepID=A0AAV7LSR4_PLEWA|nr:hypothetical protein NDU88_003705 [Pleurodeles waltl]
MQFALPLVTSLVSCAQLPGHCQQLLQKHGIGESVRQRSALIQRVGLFWFLRRLRKGLVRSPAVCVEKNRDKGTELL